MVLKKICRPAWSCCGHRKTRHSLSSGTWASGSWHCGGRWSGAAVDAPSSRTPANSRATVNTTRLKPLIKRKPCGLQMYVQSNFTVTSLLTASPTASLLLWRLSNFTTQLKKKREGTYFLRRSVPRSLSQRLDIGHFLFWSLSECQNQF